MEFSINIEDLTPEKLHIGEEVKIKVQSAMAETLFNIAWNNFGFDGEDRPTQWPALTEKYAKRVKRSDATLILSEDLIESLKWDGSNADAAVVYNDSPYAVAHQFGVPENNLPPRPFMPIQGDGLTPYSEARVIEAAGKALEEAL